MRGNEFGVPFRGASVGVGTAAVTFPAATGRTYYVTDLDAGVDAAGGRVQIRDGSTAIWQNSLPVSGTNNGTYSRSFATPISGTVGSALSVYVGTANTVSYVNVSGYWLPA